MEIAMVRDAPRDVPMPAVIAGMADCPHTTSNRGDAGVSHRARMMTRVCLVGGVHTRGSRWAAECPLRNAAKRSERSRKAAVTRYAPRWRSVASQEGGRQPASWLRPPRDVSGASDNVIMPASVGTEAYDNKPDGERDSVVGIFQRVLGPLAIELWGARKL